MLRALNIHAVYLDEIELFAVKDEAQPCQSPGVDYPDSIYRVRVKVQEGRVDPLIETVQRTRRNCHGAVKVACPVDQ